MTAKELLGLSADARMKGDMAEAIAYAKEAADMGDEKGRELYHSFLLNRFLDALNSGDMEAAKQAARESAAAGDANAIKGLVARLLARCNTLEDVEECLDWCRQAEALGEDMSLDKEMAEDERRRIQLEAMNNVPDAMNNMPDADNLASTLARAQAIVMAQATAMQQAATTQQAQPGAGAWTCSCGATNTGRFCTECGASRP